MALAREVDAWKLLVEADPDVGVRLVVAEPDVEPRAVALDELLLGEQRLRLGLGDHEVDALDLPREVPEARRLLLGEVGRDALADRARLSDVDHAAPRVAEQVDTRLIGQVSPLFVERVGCLRHLQTG